MEKRMWREKALCKFAVLKYSHPFLYTDLETFQLYFFINKMELLFGCAKDFS
jgi:hypothetical protein